MLRKMRFGLLAAVLVVAAAVACSSSDDPAGGTPTGTSNGHGTVGKSGGDVATSDGVLTVSVPAGALPADTQITITEIRSPAAGAIGKTFDIGPSGTQFTTPVTLKFKYSSADLSGTAATSLEVATIVNGEWVALANGAVDTGTQIATGQTTHLSPYGVHAKSSVHGDDGGTSADASGAGDGAVSQDAGVHDAGFDASSCTRVAQQVGSCANHPVQICTAGKVFTSCTDLTPMGYSAYCCPPGL
jgi:hypothetical protein